MLFPLHSPGGLSKNREAGPDGSTLLLDIDVLLEIEPARAEHARRSLELNGNGDTGALCSTNEPGLHVGDIKQAHR